ncbi:MAG: AAA family ATPase [Endomicrobium sp.]|jgi:dCMP deaminase|nr:AAA family ATPase [Endomicrobium sp.]
MIIGLTGSYCSGKDTVADYIVKKHNYKHYSLSDVIREIMKEKDIEPTRENLIAFGTKLREENGNGILAKKVLEKIGLNGKCCITSIRHSDEVKELNKRKDFILINIDAPQSVRFERMQKRKRTGDPQILKKFIEFEKKESQIKGSGQQLRKTANMADITFINDSNSIATLEVKVEKLLKDIENK